MIKQYQDETGKVYYQEDNSNQRFYFRPDSKHSAKNAYSQARHVSIATKIQSGEYNGH